MTHARSCCCGVDDDPVCPGVAGYCARVELVDFESDPACIVQGQRGVQLRMRQLAVNGPLSVAMDPFTDQVLSITGKGYARFVALFDESRSFWDTNISATIVVSCEPGTQRPYLRNCSARIGGGGDIEQSLPAGDNLFRGSLSGSIPGGRLYLDQGPVLVPNVYRDPDVYPDTACTVLEGGPPLAVTASGFMRIELVFSTSCEPQSADQVIARACDGSGVEIAVDPSQAGDTGVVEYEGQLYRLDRRGSGDVVPAVPSSESCDDPGELIWLARECRGPGEIGVLASGVPQATRSVLYQGSRYELTRSETQLEAVAVSYSSKTCSGIDLPDCTGISQDDPRCRTDPLIRLCPQCRNQSDGGRPQGEPSGGQIGEDQDDQFPGLGDLVARAAELLRIDKLVDPDRCGCERRRELLNDMGRKYGQGVARAVWKRLGR